MSKKREVIIVGAGPGGLTAGMLLQNKGYQVTIFEKADRVGGGTHPGSGLPTIYESARISVNLYTGLNI